MFLFFLLVASCFVNGLRHNEEGDSRRLINLIGEPDYHRVRLQWESYGKDRFDVKYCEMQVWGTQRCRNKLVKIEENNETGKDDEDEKDIKFYSTEVDGLRMATTYSFEIKTDEKSDREGKSYLLDNKIVLPTKGFSAKATQCLPHASVIEVSTGPHFGGRIAVEAADGERCVLDGQPENPKDVYTLRINHTECGSKVNETTVATYVLVQENLPILTHSTRRFLVLCSYQPETLTVRAGINLPAKNDGVGRARASRTGRLLNAAKLIAPEPLLGNEIDRDSKNVEKKEEEKSIRLVFLSLFVVVGFVTFVAMAVKCKNSKITSEESDNVSIASDTSAITIEDQNDSKHDENAPVID